MENFGVALKNTDIEENISLGHHKWLALVPIGAYLIYRMIRKYRRELQLPPGPTGWPWFGYTKCLGQDAFKKVQLLCQKYGPVLSFRLCGKLIIILSNEETIKEAAFKHRRLIGRHTMLTNHLLAKGHGISNYDEENALSLRRILVGALHQIRPNRLVCDLDGSEERSPGPSVTQAEGTNKSFIDDKLETECRKLVAYLEQKNGAPVKVNSHLRRLVFDVVWKAAFGTNCALDDATITELLQGVAENNSKNGPFQFKQMLPNFLSVLLKHSKITRKIFGVDEIWNRYERITRTLKRAVAEVRSSSEHSKNCLMSIFLDNGEYIVSRADADRVAFEIIAAGVDTTTLTLMWSCYALATGKLELKPKEPFTEAHLEVVHRLASVVPMALPHCTHFDSHVGGYLIPKGSIVFYNLFAVHQSQLRSFNQTNSKSACPCVPNKDPQHKLYFCESALPFSAGSRACPGFVFATRMITRIMSCIVAKFRIEECSGKVNFEDSNLQGLTRPPLTETYRFIVLK